MKRDKQESAGRISDERIEQLLYQHGPLQLSPDFRANVMDSVRRLPSPRLIARRRGLALLLDLFSQLSTGEKFAAVLALAALAALLIPGSTGLLTLWGYELEGIVLSFSIGESALSLSALSALLLLVVMAFVAAVGAYTAKHRLISA